MRQVASVVHPAEDASPTLCLCWGDGVHPVAGGSWGEPNTPSFEGCWASPQERAASWQEFVVQF